MSKPKALFILGLAHFHEIYTEELIARIQEMCEVSPMAMTAAEVRADWSVLADVEFIFSGWGGPKLDQEFLEHAPKLKAIFYGAGSIKGLVTPEFWRRDIVITSSWVANAVPVSEFALAEILFSLKLGWRYALGMKRSAAYMGRQVCPGAYHSTVALISLGMIGKKVARLLAPFDVNVIAYDPFAKAEDAAALGVELVSLEDAFRRGDVVSLHTPWLKETENMITGELFRSMKADATFINTSRGAIVCEAEMCRVLAERPDLTAVLDVTWPEPAAADSPLYTLPNVVLTPHIAGSLDGECARMGEYAVEECRRFLQGEALKYRVTEQMAARMA